MQGHLAVTELFIDIHMMAIKLPVTIEGRATVSESVDAACDD